MLCSTSLPRLLFWGSVNTGFRLGLLSVVRTTGHACIKMLNVRIKSICLLRNKNRRYPSFFCFFSLLVDSQILWISVYLIAGTDFYLLFSHFLPGEKKKKKKSLNQVISIRDNQIFVCSLILWENLNATALSLHLSCNIEL